MPSARPDIVVSLAPPKLASVIPEDNIIRQKLSRRAPARTPCRSRASSRRAPIRHGRQHRKPHNRAAYAAYRLRSLNSNASSSSASCGARVKLSATTLSSSFDDAAAVVAIDDPGASCVAVPDTAVPTKMQRMMRRHWSGRGDSPMASSSESERREKNGRFWSLAPILCLPPPPTPTFFLTSCQLYCACTREILSFPDWISVGLRWPE